MFFIYMFLNPPSTLRDWLTKPAASLGWWICSRELVPDAEPRSAALGLYGLLSLADLYLSYL